MNHKDAQIAEEQENNKETIEDTNLVFCVATSFASSYFYFLKTPAMQVCSEEP